MARAMLVLQESPGVEPRRWALDAPTTTIGRWEESDVRLANPEISRKHAQVRQDGASHVLIDLDSKNGTLVNGVRIEHATVLADGDEIILAPGYRLLFVDGDATVPSARGGGGVRVDPVTRRVTVAGRPLDPPLAPNQYALVVLLCSAPGRVFTRDEIALACYPTAEGGVSDQAIDGLVRRLRARLAAADPDHEHVVALRGHGFRLQP